jgi:colanic acid/amylovoran biosynthesis glycosyltransferase
MKLAYLLSEYPTLIHTYLLREVRELRALGWEIQTVSIRRPGPPTSSLSSAENEELASTWYVLSSSAWEFLRAHVSTVLRRPLRYFTGLRTAWRFGRYHPRSAALAMGYFAEAILVGYRLHKAGFTHVHSVYTTTVGLILARVFPIEISITIHGSDEFIDPEGFRMEEKIRAALFISAISYFGKSQIMRWSSPQDWSKIEVTPLGIDTEGWAAAPLRENPAVFNVITVGRLVPVKGYSLLLEAMAILVAQGRHTRLTFVGDGPDRSRLEKRAEQLEITDHVVFAGWKGQNELLEFYRGSDLCVLSSFAEGVPVVLMEAMALGVPCVAPRITGIPELVRHGIEGILVTPANVEELAAAIAEMIDKPDVRRSMAGASRERIAKNYDLRKNVARLSKFFMQYGQQSSASSDN